MRVALFGIVIDVKPLQPENALSPMLVTPFPIVTDVKPLQPENALPSMRVTLFGIVIDVKPLQPKNALFSMRVTLPSAGILLFLQPVIKVLLAVSIKQFPAL